MEIWKYGKREIGKYRNMEIWKYGNREICKNGNMEIWKYRNKEIWKYGNNNVANVTESSSQLEIFKHCIDF